MCLRMCSRVSKRHRSCGWFPCNYVGLLIVAGAASCCLSSIHLNIPPLNSICPLLFVTAGQSCLGLAGASWLMMVQQGRKRVLPPVVSPVCPEGRDLIGRGRGVKHRACWEEVAVLVWRLSSLPKMPLICCGLRSHWHIDDP